MNNSVGPEGVDAIAGMNLEFTGLYLARKLSQAELTSLGKSSSPQFNFWSCDFDEEDLAVFAKHSRVENLGLIDSKVSNEGILELQNMKSLKQVHFGSTNYELSTFHTLVKLKPDLTVSWNEGAVTGSDVPSTEKSKDIGASETEK